jgi:ATP-dependent Lhr-like helicase
VGCDAVENGTKPGSPASELARGGGKCTIIQVGQRRALDLGIEIPSDELGSVTTTAMWEEVFDRLAQHALAHRSTLVFVNTRRLVEKIAFALSERLTPELGPDCVAAHHGSLSRELRLDAEQRLKNGEVRILVATASLELGIDIGSVDLVCQIASTRAVAVAMQRVGRAGHWRGAIPKGRLFATTRDDLLEQAALVRKMRAGELDRLEIPPQPIDVLMQQIVACVAAEPWDEDALFAVLRRAYPYRNLTRALFDEIVTLLSEGIESSRGRYGAYLLRDRVHGQLHPRRGSRSIAISNGGAIPDTALFNVILQPEGVQIATLDEHFAVESSPGDVVLLGNTSWRIQRIEAAGRVLVEDAHGAPPTLPFWFGEAPQRTAVLSGGVGELREQISAFTRNVSPADVRPSHPEVAACIAWLMDECNLCASAARQLIAYIVAGRAVLGAVPSSTTIIAERFFDEGGGMQLILHAPFGGRINKAWGLALRKRFCRGFNFELQAAATDNGINISLAEQHSFPLSDVFHFLTEQTAKTLLEQAAIASPIFKTRWRWAANRSLQLLRMSKGKRIAPQIQRTRSDDLLASVFPQAAACFETIVGDIQIPNHPLVNEVMQDVLQEAMDLEGLNEILRGIASGAIRCLAVDTAVPSQFAHELINANPYAFLDDAGLEERRTRAVNLRRDLPPSVSDGAGRLDQGAIDQIRREIFPDIRDQHELHDLLHSLIALPLSFIDASPGAPSFAASSQTGAPSGRSLPAGVERVGSTNDTRHWPLFFERLTQTGRAQIIDLNGIPCWTATERLPHIAALSHHAVILSGEVRASANLAVEGPAVPADASQQATEQVTKESALKQCVQGWLQITGPTTATAFVARLALDPTAVFQAFLAMEMQGLLMRGALEHPATSEDHEIEWCERRILQRIHRFTLATARKQVEAVAPAVYLRWLLGWQHLAPQTQLTGEQGVLEALYQLEGFEAPAVEWERTLLPARIANYDPRWLDQLCLSGTVGWGRVSPHPAWAIGDGSAPRRVIPTNAAPITFYIRESADWLPHALAQQSIDEQLLAAALSTEALAIRALLARRGACFAADLQRLTGLTRQQTARALWELATAGLASADGFDQLRALMDPRRKPATADTAAKRPARTTAGRWSLLIEPAQSPGAPSMTVSSSWVGSDDARAAAQSAAIQRAKQTDAALESFARQLLARYGILFRDLLTRESNAPRWRDLLNILRRLEARGEVRGGRFVTGFGGEQFALPEAVTSLHASRNQASTQEIAVAAADPLNLVGIVLPGERVPAVPGREVRYRNGSLAAEDVPNPEAAAAEPAPAPRKHRFQLPSAPPFPTKPATPPPLLF